MMAHEFKLLRRIQRERSGIVLSEDKMDLVEAKLRPLLKEFGFPSFAHLTLALMKPNAERLRARVAQSIAVLETYFFRDKAPFNYFADVMLPRLMEARKGSRRIRIWCVASSTGQEPYSLAMILADAGQKLDGWTVDIVATDFVEDALLKAKKGVYTQFDVQRGLPVAKLVQYLQQVGNGWQIKPEIRSKVTFREHNLLDDCQGLGIFDVIFCRNVLIYFDEQLKSAVLGRLAGQLASDGYLVLGAAETTSGASPDFTRLPTAPRGIFCMTPLAAAQAETALQRRLAKAARTGVPADTENAASGDRSLIAEWGSHGAKPPIGSPTEQSDVAVPLDRQTADLLAAIAKARGISVAELLTEMAASEPPAPEVMPRHPFKTVGRA